VAAIACALHGRRQDVIVERRDEVRTGVRQASETMLVCDPARERDRSVHAGVQEHGNVAESTALLVDDAHEEVARVDELEAQVAHGARRDRELARALPDPSEGGRGSLRAWQSNRA
jgi:hypothetical protein